jgi:uncharacterized repeat protein (TIGR01451 family)
MRHGKKIIVVLSVSLVSACGGAASAHAAATAPAWSIRSTAVPTNFVPGDIGGDYFYEVIVENSGGKATNGNPLTLTDTLPAGVDLKKVELPLRDSGAISDHAATFCKATSGSGQPTITCTVPAELSESTPALLGPSEQVRMVLYVSVPPEIGGFLLNTARVQGGGAPAAETVSENPASSSPAPPGFEEFSSRLIDPEGLTVTQAGAHPYQYTTSFSVNTKATPPGTDTPIVPAGGDVKDVEVKLPPGLVGNPTAAEACTQQAFNTSRPIILPGNKGFFSANECPDGSVVGLIVIQRVEGVAGALPLPLYNLVPPKGMPAQLGFQVLGAPFYIDTSIRTGGDYGISATLQNVSEARRIIAASVTLWGAPAESVHDPLRGECLNQIEDFTFDSLGTCPAGVAVKPFFRLPTSCGAPLVSEMKFDTWNNPGAFVSTASTSPALENCALLPFSPAVSVQPQVTTADSPSGLRFKLHLPQHETSGSLATADLRDAVVTLPEGVALNPASAAGLTGCTPAQIELHGPQPSACPGASKVGSVEVSTPLLDHPVKGAVYLAAQEDNPFNSLIAIYIAVADPESGVVLKLAGKVESDPRTGRLTTRFTENPQLPFEDLSVELFEGPRAPLRTPARCGTYTTTTSLTPWSAPESGPPATPSDSFSISAGPGAQPCPNGSLDPHLTAGLSDPIAGSYSPFTLRLSRDDGTAEFESVDVSTPRGLLAKLAGVPYCQEAQIASASARTAPRGGMIELASPSCPAASRVGTVTVGVGAGPNPFYTSGGLFLAGPYKGAPLSLVATVPAVAGPFDLGVVTDRIALFVNPKTAAIMAKGDPFPTILFGIPLDVRDVRIDLNRRAFTLAPTSCSPMSVEATVHGVTGSRASASDRFQVGACDALKFAPKLALSLKGGSRRGAHPALRAVLRAKPGEANIGRISVALPHSEFLEQSHIRTICTRAQFPACPSGSIYGKAKVFTPLLARPLEGPVYLRSSKHLLPDLVMALKGQIDIELAGRIDSIHGGLRTTFATVPDAPVSKVVLEMRGGKKGLLLNSRNICRANAKALVKATAHNGRHRNFRAVLQPPAACK